MWINNLTSLLIDQSAPVHALEQMFEDAATNLRGAELGPFQRRAKQTFCQACFDGDVDKVLFFLDGLPEFFTWLSKECANDANAVSWACYGKQTQIVRLISERQDPETFIGFDFDVALEILDQARDDEAPLKPIDYDQWHGRSTAEAIHKVAIRENDKSLLRVVADVLEKNLDKFFEQIGV